MMIATILHRVLPGGMAIDLINVAFASPKVVQGHTEGLYATPDRITAIDGLKELEFACLGRTWNLVKVNVDSSEVLQHRERVRSLIAPLDSVLDDSIGLAIWFAARGRGGLQAFGLSTARGGGARSGPVQIRAGGDGDWLCLSYP